VSLRYLRQSDNREAPFGGEFEARDPFGREIEVSGLKLEALRLPRYHYA